MSDHTSFKVQIRSRKYPTADEYSFELERLKMSIKGAGTDSAICRRVEGKDPQWSSTAPEALWRNLGNPLVLMLENENVYPPSIFIHALEAAWRAWREAELTDDAVEREMGFLADWLNVTMENRPTSVFWKKAF